MYSSKHGYVTSFGVHTSIMDIIMRVCMYMCVYHNLLNLLGFLHT